MKIFQRFPAAISGLTPSLGFVVSLTQLAVAFGEAVANVSRSELVAGGFPAAAVTASGAVYTFKLEWPPEYG